MLEVRLESLLKDYGLNEEEQKKVKGSEDYTVWKNDVDELVKKLIDDHRFRSVVYAAVLAPEVLATLSHDELKVVTVGFEEMSELIEVFKLKEELKKLEELLKTL